jgi:glycosyltransferase involved in cell wall biosynthesis
MPIDSMLKTPSASRIHTRASGTGRDRQLRILFISRAYPNNVLKLLGLWVEGLVRHCARSAECKVIAPVPYCPPVPGLGEEYSRFRRISHRSIENGVEVFHPRFVVPPGHWFHGTEGVPYYLSAARLASKLRREFPFDVIHAHFSYPDGWVAAKLGRKFGVPVIITEQNPWKPWMDDFPFVLKQAKWAAEQSAFHVAISTVVRDEIAHFTGDTQRLRTIPDGVDDSIFKLPNGAVQRKNNQILFVGVIRPVKGVDVLIKALRLLADKGRTEKLVLVGESFYVAYKKEYDRLRQMTIDLGLGDRVEFAGGKPIGELVRYMQESGVLVLPSRKESLGMVLVEALACGTPVVATHCGGPADIVNDNVGALVPPDNPEALAHALEQVIDRGRQYDPAALRAHALEKFSWQRITEQYFELYREAIAQHKPA